MLRVVLVAAAAALVGACNQTTGQSAATASEPAPANYRDQVTARVKRSFVDPYSIRDAAISRPFVQSAAFDGVTPIPHSGWMVCIKANAKNRMGGYTGLTETGYMFKAGMIVDTDFKGHFCAAAAATYEPFPEIEQGGQPAGRPAAAKR